MNTHRRSSQRHQSDRRPGAMLLIEVLVVGAVAMSLVIGSALRGVGETTMGTGEARAKEVYAIADACLDEGLRSLTLNDAYTGGTLTIGNGSCTITVTPTTGAIRSISATAVRDRWTAQAEVRVNTSGTKLVIVWRRQK